MGKAISEAVNVFLILMMKYCAHSTYCVKEDTNIDSDAISSATFLEHFLKTGPHKLIKYVRTQRNCLPVTVCQGRSSQTHTH